MSEIKCYSVDVPMDALWSGQCTMPDVEKMTLPTRCKGFVGVNPNYRNDVCHFLYDTPKHRNKAYEKIRKKMVAFLNPRTALVDEKYLQGRLLWWMKNICRGDDNMELTEIMREAQQSIGGDYEQCSEIACDAL